MADFTRFGIRGTPKLQNRRNIHVYVNLLVCTDDVFRANSYKETKPILKYPKGMLGVSLLIFKFLLSKLLKIRNFRNYSLGQNFV